MGSGLRLLVWWVVLCLQHSGGSSFIDLSESVRLFAIACFISRSISGSELRVLV